MKRDMNELNDYAKNVLSTLNVVELMTAQALIRAAYNMGYDDHKKHTPSLELIGFDKLSDFGNEKIPLENIED